MTEINNKLLERRAKDKERYQEKRRSMPWYKHWKALRQRCNDPKARNYKWYGAKGIRCEITVDEIKKLWIRDRAYEMIEPHLSRKDHDKNYTFKNCLFTDKKFNVGERNIRVSSKPIFQYDLDGNFVQKWPSAVEASRKLNIDRAGIFRVLRGTLKQLNGYIFKREKI